MVAPVVEGATVTAKVEKQGKQKKITVFKYKAKKNYRRKQGHRQPYTKVVDRSNQRLRLTSMIKVTVDSQKENDSIVQLSGHADFARKGQDFVCAGASAVAFGSVNAIL